MSLKQITIEHLRGAVMPFSLPFEKGKKLTIIYGENGTGKSTICDAFEFLGHGKVGSLENRGLGQTTRFWPSLGKIHGDVSVRLETADGSCKASIVGGNVVVNPVESRPTVEVFRKNQILSLITAKPAERYNAISRFIDVSGVEASETSLRELVRSLKDDQRSAIAALEQNDAAIRQFWSTAGSPPGDPFAWAEAECARGTDVFDAERAALNELQKAYSRLVPIPEELRLAQENVKQAEKDAEEPVKVLDELVKKTAEDAAETVGVLQAAQVYLTKNPSTPVCPLCESAEKTAGLANRIQQRLAAFSAIQQAQAKAASAKVAFDRAQQQLELRRTKAKEEVTRFEQLIAEFQWPTDIRLPASPVPNSMAGLRKWLDDSVDMPGEWRAAEDARQDKKHFIGTLRLALKTWKENSATQRDLIALIPRLEKAHEIAVSERRQFTDEILSGISNEVGKLYEIVHPGEGLNKIGLELDAKKKASLEIGASFCGRSTPPQAYFSDSHLDTLGLCVFLALAALDQPAETILVLDDVLASVDEPHVERLIGMLYSEALRFRHCIITTHYRPWREKYRWGWLRSGQCQFVELTGWKIDSGLTLIRSVPDIERLRTLLAEVPPDLQLICSKAGVILEAALNFLTLQYECHAPRRASGLYTLGDLLQAVDKKLRQALRIDVLTLGDCGGSPTYETVHLRDCLDELTRIAQARNAFGCHFNALSFELMDADAVSFAQKVLELMDVLTDGEAGWPKNDKSGEYWATAGETRRLYPLKRPS